MRYVDIAVPADKDRDDGNILPLPGALARQAMYVHGLAGVRKYAHRF